MAYKNNDDDGGPKKPAKLPIKNEPRCHVCQSTIRDFIDRMAVEGFGTAYIARHVQEVDPTLSRKSIERHISRHLTYEEEAIRQLVEERAREAGNIVEDIKGRMITRDAYIDRMIQKGWDQMLSEESWVKHQDVLKAIELKNAMETMQASTITDQYKRQLSAIIQAVKEIAPSDLWTMIAERAQAIYDDDILEMAVVIRPAIEEGYIEPDPGLDN